MRLIYARLQNGLVADGVNLPSALVALINARLREKGASTATDPVPLVVVS